MNKEELCKPPLNITTGRYLTFYIWNRGLITVSGPENGVAVVQFVVVCSTSVRAWVVLFSFFFWWIGMGRYKWVC